MVAIYYGALVKRKGRATHILKTLVYSILWINTLVETGIAYIYTGVFSICFNDLDYLLHGRCLLWDPDNYDTVSL